jgi:glycopeptide antibiotics resistance protein
LLLRKTVVGVLLLSYLAFVAYITLVEFQGDPGVNLVPFRQIMVDVHEGGRNFVVNILGNLGLFVPVGLALPLLRSRPTRAWHAGLVAMALSLAIELAQFALGKRVADIDDVLMNTVGGVIGFAAGSFFHSRR